MDLNTLNKWADLLLDMGKRNNLINFRNTKMGTAEIVAPDFCSLFYQVVHTAEFEVYDPKLEDEEEDYEFIEDTIPKEDGKQDGESGKPSTEPKYTKEQYCSMYERRLRKGQVLIYNSANKPIQALKNICKKGRIAIEETGVNILYLAFGFINWTEDENSQYVMKAPLLLVPISIENDSAVAPYRIKVSDDEIIVNPTFSYKLQNDFGVKLPEFEDDDDIEAYLDKVDRLVAKMKWTVSRECKLGVFSFQKNNMYQDLKNNAETIANSKNVRALMGERDVSTFGGASDDSESTAFDLVELHNVVDADSSQSEAIEMAKKGRNFVLQGPPGTGKSQTITNIIAECLSDGKRVLFVSEKLAALNVVYEKLKKVGLEEFCLELHSHKANKKQVINELCDTLIAKKSVLSDKANRELDYMRQSQTQLNNYEAELHKMRPVINKTLYRLYEEISACRNAPDIEFAISQIKTKGEDYIEQAVTTLERYVEYIPSIGCDYHKYAWYGLDIPDITYAVRMQLNADLCATIDLCASLNQVSKTISSQYDMVVDDIDLFEVYQKFFSLIKDCKFITPVMLNSQSIQITLKNVRLMKSLAEKVLATRAYLDEIYDSDIFEIDGIAAHKKLTRQFASFFSRLFNRNYKQIISDFKLRLKLDGKLKYNMAVQHAEALRIYQESAREYERLESEIISLLNKSYNGVHTEFDEMIAELNALALINETGVKYGNLVNMSVEEFANHQRTFEDISVSIDAAFSSCDSAESRLSDQFNNDCQLKRLKLNDLSKKCKSCQQNIDQVENWCAFTKLLKRMQELEIKDFIDHTIGKKVSAEYIPLSYKKAFCSQWADAILHEAPILLDLARIPHDELVERFKEKDELYFEINKAKIRATVSAKRPNLDMVAQGSAISILIREGEKKRKQKSVRNLLSEIGDLALILKPCFLMSPLSVSTFLSPDMHFDVVIFDEASQIFPQDAVGAIYRGKQLIVVGDSKQMPPSNFFGTSIDADDDSEDESITDFESILDLCSTTFPRRRLRWHYRSRYEQLISFSNKNFYGNELVTFPSAKADEKGVGVDYCYVDGTFDRQSKTNRTEAERIVELVFENIEKYPERSLGVVAFSAAQQNLIENLITKRRQCDSSKEEFFKADCPEPFFVKNLETVQGDERDTIIFSIAYAKDSQGRLLMNFGPINREGGERRLNVAVTRAKYNVQLVTSMHYTDIDLSRTQSVGARLLREYLDYAENGIIALERSVTASTFDHFDSEFEMEVCDFLREHGYDVDTQVGCSSFKIDLGLKQPNSSNYLLAIECDGAAYHSSKTARDRDRLRQSILENMGWKFYRIWSTDWFRNKQNEKKRLLDAVKAAIEDASHIHREPPQTVEPQTAVTFIEKAPEDHFEFPIYEMVDAHDIHGKHNFNRMAIIHAILEVEAPLSEEWLLRRIAYLYGREKVTSVVTEQYERDMCSGKYRGIIRRDGFLYLKDKEIPMLRVPGSNDTPREIKFISEQELALGIKEILRQNVSADKMGLFRSVAKHLGFNRVGDAILARFESSLALLEDEVEIDGEIVRLERR